MNSWTFLWKTPKCFGTYGAPANHGRFVDSFNPSRLTGFWAEFCKISDRNLIAHALLYGRLLDSFELVSDRADRVNEICTDLHGTSVKTNRNTTRGIIERRLRQSGF